MVYGLAIMPYECTQYLITQFEVPIQKKTMLKVTCKIQRTRWHDHIPTTTKLQRML